MNMTKKTGIISGAHLLKIFLFMATIIIIKAQVPFDVSLCFENRDCSIQSVGSFFLGDKNYKHNSTLAPPLGGHIYQVLNGLSYDAFFYWDIIGGERSAFDPTGKDDSDNNNSRENWFASSDIFKEENFSKHSIFIPSGSIRYIDSGIYKTHIVRLFIKIISTPASLSSSLSSSSSSDNKNTFYETVDKAIGQEEKKCSGGIKSQICDYLFRICYFNKKYETTGSGSNNNNDGSLCLKYEDTCKLFYKKTDDEKCVETCAMTYFGHMLTEQEKVSFNFDRLSMVKCIIDNQHIQKLKKGNIFPEWNVLSSSTEEKLSKSSTDNDVNRLQTTVTILSVILAILIFFLIVVIFFWARSRYHTAVSSNSGQNAPSSNRAFRGTSWFNSSQSTNHESTYM
jgi:hypothetical protein